MGPIGMDGDLRTDLFDLLDLDRSTDDVLVGLSIEGMDSVTSTTCSTVRENINYGFC